MENLKPGVQGGAPTQLAESIRRWAAELGFAGVSIAGVDLGDAELRLRDWLDQGRHGTMDYMAARFPLRARPAELVAEAASIISVRMDYLPATAHAAESVLADPELGYISRYALGRDYHKVLRHRLQRLAERIEAVAPASRLRVCCDSVPLMEVELAARGGLGWRGKHTLLLNREAGSWFFLGEIVTDLALPADEPTSEHCGTCQRCIDVCPTRAIVAPYQIDARLCVSYLTIEHHGSIPEPLRELMGNRIYGCDDCQLACPWNRYAQSSPEADFAPRNALDAARLVELFTWSAADFDTRLAGSAIRRIGHERWLRNIAVALGNAPTSAPVIEALETRRDHPSPLVREHVTWALAQHGRVPH